MAGIVDQAHIGQLQGWIAKHDLYLRELTEAEADRVAKLYHEAMAAEEAEAHRMNDSRSYAKHLASEARHFRTA